MLVGACFMLLFLLELFPFCLLFCPDLFWRAVDDSALFPFLVALINHPGLAKAETMVSLGTFQVQAIKK